MSLLLLFSIFEFHASFNTSSLKIKSQISLYLSLFFPAKLLTAILIASQLFGKEAKRINARTSSSNQFPLSIIDLRSYWTHSDAVLQECLIVIPWYFYFMIITVIVIIIIELRYYICVHSKMRVDNFVVLQNRWEN